MRFDTTAIKKAYPLLKVFEERKIEFFPSGSDRFMARCPLPGHDDSTPSFTIYPDQHFHCFGCGEGGDVIRLVQKLDGLSFPDACQLLVNGEEKTFTKPSAEGAGSGKEQLCEAVAAHWDVIQANYAWSLEEIRESSPVSPDSTIVPFHQQLSLLKMLFDSSSVIWTGEVRDSGKPEHAKHFLPVGELVGQLIGNEATPLGPMICPAIFRPGVYSRSSKEVQERPYLVVECDEAIGKKPGTDEEKLQNKLACGAVIRWMKERLGMQLAAVIDTGNKSLHGWFQMPPDRLVKELEMIAGSLRLDDNLFKPAQPVRLPQVTHEQTGQQSRLLYLRNCISQ